MAEHVQLTAADGHGFSAYRDGTDGPGLVVVQEIFGVNSHIRSVVERFAAQGFAAVAPALFDRLGPGIEIGYTAEDVETGRGYKARVSDDEALADVAAAIALLAGEGRKVGVVGYCWGGALTWGAATRLDGVSAAVGYYGGGIVNTADAVPRCPVMLHFGEQDHGIPMTDVETIIAAQPDVPVHTYPAGHGFSCDARASFHAEAHELALSRTLEFLRLHLG